MEGICDNVMNVRLAMLVKWLPDLLASLLTGAFCDQKILIMGMRLSLDHSVTVSKYTHTTQ